jgi:hypothetical protein
MEKDFIKYSSALNKALVSSENIPEKVHSEYVFHFLF